MLCRHQLPPLRAVTMVTSSLAWLMVILAVSAIRHSLELGGSCSRHATTCEDDNDHDDSSDDDSDADLLHAPDVVPDLLQELLLVTLLARVLHIAQEHPGLVNLDTAGVER